MTYRAGCGPLLARELSLSEARSVPSLACDVQCCGFWIEVKPYRGCMPGWLANNKAPKGWKRIDRGALPAQHICPLCVKAERPGGYFG